MSDENEKGVIYRKKAKIVYFLMLIFSCKKKVVDRKKIGMKITNTYVVYLKSKFCC